MKSHYKGWSLHYLGGGQFVAFRFGVRLSANSEKLLMEMIDLRNGMKQ
jgi:hypothetical protein